MTIRSVILGLLGACFICAVTYFNDGIMRQTYLIGNHMPVAVYAGLIVFVVLVNPLLRRMSPRWALTGGELAVILALTFAACCIPTSGFLRTFTPLVVLPHHYDRVEPGWSAQGVVDMLPDKLLVNVTPQNEERVLTGYMQGLPRPPQGESAGHISLFDVPWAAWSGTLWFWLPLTLSLWIALIGLSVVLHRQWSAHEQLPYPLATFAHSLMPGKDRSRSPVFKHRMFWIAAACVAVVHLNNCLHSYFPDHLVPVRTHIGLGSLIRLFPTLMKGEAGGMFSFTIYPTVIGLAYFLATDVSLSLGLVPYFYGYLTGTFNRYGVSFSRGGPLEPKIISFLHFGAFLATFISLFWIGRRYYIDVIRRALFIPARDKLDSAPVWGARVFLLGSITFALLLTSAQVDWQLAVILTILFIILFTVAARMLAETGIFFIIPRWFPGTILAGTLGYYALDPKTLAILLLVTTVLAIDPRECLMPFIVNAFKLVDLSGVRIGRTAICCTVALLLGMAVALPVTLYFQYDRGMNKLDTWATQNPPKFAFAETIRVRQRLIAQDKLEATESVSGWQRLRHLSPRGPLLIALAAGASLVAVCTFCRLHFPRWPIHPVVFLVWATYPGAALAGSFLLGWFVKVIVTKYGGAAAYQKFKPAMYGLIAGDMLGGVTPLLIGLLPYFITGEPPKTFWVTPG